MFLCSRIRRAPAGNLRLPRSIGAESWTWARLHPFPRQQPASSVRRAQASCRQGRDPRVLAWLVAAGSGQRTGRQARPASSSSHRGCDRRNRSTSASMRWTRVSTQPLPLASMSMCTSLGASSESSLTAQVKTRRCGRSISRYWPTWSMSSPLRSTFSEKLPPTRGSTSRRTTFSSRTRGPNIHWPRVRGTSQASNTRSGWLRSSG